jgi:two-component system, sporulation sensor kinase D
MDLYSNKQRWKILLITFSLLVIGASLFVSNSMINSLHAREREKAKQWVSALQKKIALVQLTTKIFKELRQKEKQKIQLVVDAQRTLLNPSDLSANQDVSFALSIIESNKDIPVILLADDGTVSQFKNLPDSIRTEQQQIDLAQLWINENRFFELIVFGDMKMMFTYGESAELQRLSFASDSLLNRFGDDLLNDVSLTPVILLDKESGNIEATNLPNSEVSPSKLRETLALFKSQNQPLEFDFGTGKKALYFAESKEVRQLSWLPYIQFGVIGFLVFLGYLLFSTFRKAEQNQVWAGMAKETAHQLGTPLSSLMAWVTYLESTHNDPMVAQEMQKDLDRLEKITDRFSKIGSESKLTETDFEATVQHNLDYLQARLSNKVQIEFIKLPEETTVIQHNASLMGWVIENLCKNAVDAMEGEGKLTLKLSREGKKIHLDISDTGKGIAQGQFKSVFQPGFSTKKRGWGLGLALVKRIVESYHKGKVFVLHSEANVGTTFRITLNVN